MQNKPLFFYGQKEVEYRGKQFTRRVTVAGVIEGGNLKVATAMCSEKDRFTKERGRHIAAARALNHPCDTVVLIADESPAQQFMSKAKEFVD